MFSVKAFFIWMSDQPVAGAGMDKVNPFGITKEKGELNMKARFQIFKAPFYFVGWLAPAYRDGRSQSQRDHETGITKGLGICNPFGIIYNSYGTTNRNHPGA